MTPTAEAVELTAPGHESWPAILVIDDDAGMRALFEVYLRSLGFRVVLAGGGDEGMRMIAVNPDIVLIIMDVIMSGLSGQRLVDDARTARPGIRILFCSGHSAKELERYGLDHLAESEFVQKPCNGRDLKAKVEGLLARPAAS